MFLFGEKKRLLIEFANRTAEELTKDVPSEIVEQHLLGKSKKSSKKFTAGVDKAFQRISAFKASEKPGLYGKAKLHQVFASRLHELGYPTEIVDEINSFMLTN